MSTIVGALAVELGLDTAQFEKSLKNLPGVTRTHMNAMSSEMQRSVREGQEAFRVFDEVIGVHLDRPLTRLIVERFPELANAFKGMLGGLAFTAVGFAVFEAISTGIERINRAIDDARKKEEALIAATQKVTTTFNEQSISAANSLDQINQRLAELSGDKGGALAARLRIISRSDAEQAVRSIDSISEAFTQQAKAAIEAASAVTKLEKALDYLFTSSLDQGTRKVVETGTELKNTFDTIVLSDPTKGLAKGVSYLNEELQKQKAIQAEMHKNQLSGLDEFLAKASFMDKYVSEHGAVTKETVIQQDSLVKSLEKQLTIANEMLRVDKGRKDVAAAESAAQPDPGEKILAKLRAETDAQVALAAATTQSTAAQKLQQASGEADAIIAQILTQAHGRLTAALKEQLAMVHALAAEKQVAKDAIALNQELQKETDTYDRQIASLQQLAAAYSQGDHAVAGALIEKQLEADRQKVAQLTEEYARLKAAADEYTAGKARLAGAAGPVQGIEGIDPAKLAQLHTALDQANADLEKHRQQLEAIRSLTYDEEIAKTGAALRDEQPYLDALNDAYNRNAEAVRHAQVALALFHWEQAHPGATPEQIREVSAQLEQQSINQQRAADAQLASRYNIVKSYDDEIARLQRAREVLQQYGQDTLAIDAAIEDAQERQLRQWDAAAMKVGTFEQRYQAVMNELVIEGENAGEKISQSFLQAINSAEDDLAKLMTGQKVNPARIVQNMAEQITKAEIQHAVGQLAGRFGIQIPGMGAKPDGTAANPLHVSIVSDMTTRTSALATASAIGRNINAAPSGVGVGIGAGAPSEGGAALEAFQTLNSFFSSFGGGLAAGGSTKSGTAYLVGEKGPELFRPSSTGEIVPNHKLQDWTFDPHAAYARSYEAYERSLHRGAGDSGLWMSLGLLGGEFFFKRFASLLKHHPSAASTATSVGAAAPFAGVGIGAGASSVPPNFSGFMADGGDVFAGRSYIVGERGIEAFRTPALSSISSDNRDMSRGGDTHNTTYNFNGITPGDLMRRTRKQDLERVLRGK